MTPRSLSLNRRGLLLGGLGAAVGLHAQIPGNIQRLKPLTGGIRPITPDERNARIEQAKRLMAAARIDAVVLEPGSSLLYFTGVRWGRSERLMAFVLPARGEPAWIVPAFEEPRARELVGTRSGVRTWEEDESPYERIAQLLSDRGIRAGRVGLEASVRFFVFDGIRKAVPGLECVSADEVTNGCRAIKSPAEIALMQKANDIAAAAFRAAIPTLKPEMTARQFRVVCESAFRALGATGSVTITFGKATALPHGSVHEQKLREGDVVLMDGVCDVENYCADITRTIVFGKPNDRQRQIWDLERRAQDAALAAAQVGATCESVDAAARKVITGAGFGPRYKLPGLPHRTGHGIGLDVHEHPYIVAGNRTRLQPGMCFSDEPMIVISNEFGIRLEDCIYMTENGPKLFTAQSPSIEKPFA